MTNPKRLYMKRALRMLRSDNSFKTHTAYGILYTLPDGEKEYVCLTTDEVLNSAISYIENLEKRIDELEYIERIIKIAEREKI